MPSMPIYFWKDEGMKRYRSSYFESYTDVRCHGDWIKLYEDGSLSIHGRSDATLNRKGVRIGTSEIYTVLDRMEGIRDALILNIEQKDGSDFMPLFVVLEESKILDDEIRQSINQSLRKECSPRHVPDRIFSVREVPYTLSGKKMEVPLKKIFMGMDVSNVMNKDAMRNPESLLEYIEIAKSL
ncbi:MAG: acetoacetate--CoA ligase, partial [Saprospiraceae bacterium]